MKSCHSFPADLTFPARISRICFSPINLVKQCVNNLLEAYQLLNYSGLQIENGLKKFYLIKFLTNLNNIFLPYKTCSWN